MAGEIALSAEVQIDGSGDAAEEELAQLSRRLRAELLDLDVNSVEPARAGPAPDGSKGLELAALGGLLVRFAGGRALLQAVVDVVQSWLKRQDARSVKLTLDGDPIEVTGVTAADQSRLIELWIARHAPGE
jgi:hypothetical protein